eukprot:5950671-Pyramimonas_sp.AAC.1
MAPGAPRPRVDVLGDAVVVGALDRGRERRFDVVPAAARRLRAALNLDHADVAALVLHAHGLHDRPLLLLVAHHAARQGQPAVVGAEALPPVPWPRPQALLGGPRRPRALEAILA